MISETSGVGPVPVWQVIASIDPANRVTPGSAELRRQIAIRCGADGIPVDADEIIIANGGLEALNLCLAALTRPGDAVLSECPSFYGALQALEARGLRAVQVPPIPLKVWSWLWWRRYASATVRRLAG